MLGIGINKMRNDPNQVKNPKVNSSVHAEVAAIRDAGRTNLQGGVLIVARVSPKGEQAMSKPCVNCQKALKDAGIKKVYYTIESEMDLTP